MGFCCCCCCCCFGVWAAIAAAVCDFGRAAAVGPLRTCFWSFAAIAFAGFSSEYCCCCFELRGLAVSVVEAAEAEAVTAGLLKPVVDDAVVLPVVEGWNSSVGEEMPAGMLAGMLAGNGGLTATFANGLKDC